MELKLGLQEMKRVLVIEKILSGASSVNEAASELEISKRQMLRIKKSYLVSGTASVVHGNCGKTPAHAINKDVCAKVIEVFMDYRRNTDDGLNASHLTDILKKDHKLILSRQSVWRILKNNGLQIKTRKMRKYRKRRERREQMGDILYLDGSPHRWYGDKYPKATLLLCIDDATSSALAGLFIDEENRNGCFEVAYEVFKKYGLPMSFWLDRASQFITTRGQGVRNPQSELPTHWQNAMYNLGIRNIFAHSPQARGRGERANGTFQDRLCSELQYRNINDHKRANFYLNEIFIPNYNERFAVAPKNPQSLWRKPPDNIDLRKILCARTDRRVQNDNTVKHNGKRYQILRQPGEQTYAGRTIEVQEWHDGSIHLVTKGLQDFAYEEIKSAPRYKKIEGLKTNTLISDIHRSTYF